MKYVVLGGNAAGMSFVSKMLRDSENNEIVVIEKRDYISFGACGLPYYIGDYFQDSNYMIARTPEMFIERGADLRINQEVVGVNQDKKEVTILSEGKEYIESYDKLVIATGASPIVLNNMVVDHQKIFTLSNKKDGEKLKDIVLNNKDKNFTIVGTGFIGLELMDSLIKHNVNINLITKGTHIMSELYDQAIVKDIQDDILNKENVNLYLEQQIQNVKVTDTITVELQDELIQTDYLIYAVGFKPNSSFINGIKKLPNGAIITDDKMQTSIEDIYAMGDVATITNYLTKKPMYMPSATGANKLGKTLANILNNKEIYYKGSLKTSITKILDYELGRVGLTEQECIDNNIKYNTNIIKDVNQTGYYPGKTKITAKLIYSEENLQLLGIEIVGKKGVHGRVGIMSAAIFNKMTTKELGYMDLPYAPPFSKTWDFLNIIGNATK